MTVSGRFRKVRPFFRRPKRQTPGFRARRFQRWQTPAEAGEAYLQSLIEFSAAVTPESE